VHSAKANASRSNSSVRSRAPLKAELVPTMYDQQGAPFWTGTLVLDGLGLEMALNGASEVEIVFELVITDDGEETYLLPFVLENDMTAADTATSAEEAGAVFTRTETVVVDDSTIEPFASMAAGGSFQPPAAVGAGVAITVTHNFGTRLRASGSSMSIRSRRRSGAS
jgi:hypothetical protein